MSKQLRSIKFLCINIILLLYQINVNGQSLEKNLSKSGKNKSTLLKVLNHYKKNNQTEKYKAACFLIENMNIHYSINEYLENEYGDKINYKETGYDDFDVAINALNKIKDSVKLYAKQEVRQDLNNIDENYLIENIDSAYHEWKNNPWSKSYNFEVFCEYILPYRTFNEPLKKWREDYGFLIHEASIKTIDKLNPVAICSNIIKELDDFQFVMKNINAEYILSPEQLLFRRQGACPDLANLAMLASRSIGVATTFDFTPYYGASSNRHFWNTVINNKGKHIPFNGTTYDNETGMPGNYKADNKRLAKVYRYTYSLQENALATKLNNEDIPEDFLKSKNILDVTEEYVLTGNIAFKLNKNSPKICYLSVFNNNNWRIVDWVEKKNEIFKFNNMGVNLIYLPCFYVNKRKQYSQFPILVKSDAKIQFLQANFNKTFTAKLNLSKVKLNKYQENNSVHFDLGQTYNLFYWDGTWKLIGTSKAETDGVTFNFLPTNALFRILPNKPDGYERIFLIDELTKKIEWF